MKIGLLGTGFWAAETHATALASSPDVHFVGVWGRDPAKASALAERYGVRPFADADDLISEVDAVAIALPPQVQGTLALRAAEAGRHLLLDKPVALDVAIADRIVAEVDRQNLASLVFFTRRYHPDIDEFLRSVTAAGPWHGVRASMFAAIFETGSPYAASTWRREKGGLWDIGPHALAMILPVLGPVTEVTALTGPRLTTHVLLRHATGAVGTLSLTLDAPAEAQHRQMTFFGPAGLLEAPDFRGTPVDSFRTAVALLARNAASGETRHPLDVRFGREVTVILAAAERAEATGATQSL